MVGEPRWTTLLGQWMQAAACVRCIHVTRSDVLSITGSTVRACHLPQQNTEAEPPRVLALDSLLESESTCGLCFAGKGFLWSLRESTLAVQAAFTNVVENPEEPTSYSWTRLGPPVAVTSKISLPTYLLRYTQSVRANGHTWASFALTPLDPKRCGRARCGLHMPEPADHDTGTPASQRMPVTTGYKSA